MLRTWDNVQIEIMKGKWAKRKPPQQDCHWAVLVEDGCLTRGLANCVPEFSHAGVGDTVTEPPLPGGRIIKDLNVDLTPVLVISRGIVVVVKSSDLPVIFSLPRTFKSLDKDIKETPANFVFVFKVYTEDRVVGMTLVTAEEVQKRWTSCYFVFEWHTEPFFQYQLVFWKDTNPNPLISFGRRPNHTAEVYIVTLKNFCVNFAPHVGRCSIEYH